MKVSYVTEDEYDSEDFSFADEILPETYNITGLTIDEIQYILDALADKGRYGGGDAFLTASSMHYPLNAGFVRARERALKPGE